MGFQSKGIYGAGPGRRRRVGPSDLQQRPARILSESRDDDRNDVRSGDLSELAR